MQFPEPLLEPYINLGDSILNSTDSVVSGSLQAYILPLFTALVISLIVIPIMVRLAPQLGMLDKPDARKIHVATVPRVGGVGIVIGTLVPIIFLIPLDPSLQAFIIGALVLFLFGIMDDCRELGHYVKFIGQFIAVIVVVYFGDVYITHLPYMSGESVSPAVGRPFTVFAMVGMINAINHSDGLDGLAGGESLLSLCCIAYLGFVAGGVNIVIIAVATIGGLLGFMRYNTYPAKIFMGDGGSQFLGYTLGFLAVVLTQQVNPVLSPALPLLILGLPIADIIAVFAQRVYKGMNWFRASKNHIHHRLLDLGFHHYESVMLVYSVQGFMVLSAILMAYESDLLITAVYLAVVALIFVLLTLAERRDWKVREVGDQSVLQEAFETPRYAGRLSSMVHAVINYGIALFLIAGAFMATVIPTDFTVVAAVLCALLLVRLVSGYRVWFLSLRMLVYVTIVFVVYLLNTYQPAYLSGADPVTYAFFFILVVAIAMSVRLQKGGRFSVTPMDFLIFLTVIGLMVLSRGGIVSAGIMAIVLKTIILYYGCELLFSKMTSRINPLTVSAFAALLIIAARGMLEVI
jgi:UDP-GlcNAc:undecaprenyl-phosphate GlcNAc-1-phosphate transferase